MSEKSKSFSDADITTSLGLLYTIATLNCTRDEETLFETRELRALSEKLASYSKWVVSKNTCSFACIRYWLLSL